MSDLQKQWAIRLPDGSLYGRVTNWAQPGDATPLIFDTESDAQNVLDQLVHHAVGIGVHQLAATLTHRFVSDWTTTDLAHGLVNDIEQKLLGGDPS